MKDFDDYPLEKTISQKANILEELRKRDCRITRQRELIIEILLKNSSICCKELYWEALKEDSSIGIATVYRIVKTLEDFGIINRKNSYQISYEELDVSQLECNVLLKNEERVCLSTEIWENTIIGGLAAVLGCHRNDIETVKLIKTERKKERI
jgi:Fur family ferric uptake transcriptional regulator